MHIRGRAAFDLYCRRRLVPGSRKVRCKFKSGNGNYHSPEVKHWHGAKADSWFSHIAIEIPGENVSNEWCEPVSNDEYNRLK